MTPSDQVEQEQEISTPGLLLRIEGLTKRFAHHTAVDGLSLNVARGEFISLLGPSGCGKTTTLQMIGGFEAPDAGTIRLDGRDLLAMKAHQRGLGIVFQSYALFPHMTVAENVAYGLETRRIPRPERERRVEDALNLVGLGGFADRYPRRMSGGQQQRVALARALAIRPSVLLLDEPLSNLDAKLREEMQLELRRIQRKTGTTTILVTHDQAEAMALSDRIVLMNNGRIEQQGSPAEVYERPATRFVAQFLGKTNVLRATTAQQGGRTRITVGEASWISPHTIPDGLVFVRPEKIGFVEGGGCPGTVRTRIFQGTQWLLEVETAVGVMTVLRPNVGTPPPGEGEAVRLDWNVDDMHAASE